MRIPIRPQTIIIYNSKPALSVKGVVHAMVDIAGVSSRCQLYEVAHMADQGIFLGLPWMQKQDAMIHTREKRLDFRGRGVSTYQRFEGADIRQINGHSFGTLYRQKKREQSDHLQTFMASLADIEKAL